MGVAAGRVTGSTPGWSGLWILADGPAPAGSLTPMAEPDPPASTTRFLTLDDVADELAISKSQVYALVRRKDLRAGKIGGRGQWRVRRADLEAYIERTWAETSTWIDEHPFTEGEEPPPEERP
jgi:excisionase family DNA binding protein